MSGETDLNKLIATMRPELGGGTYVFVTVPFDGADPVGLGAVMSFREAEGVTMIDPEQAASAAGFEGVFPCRMVTLTVHSALWTPSVCWRPSRRAWLRPGSASTRCPPSFTTISSSRRDGRKRRLRSCAAWRRMRRMRGDAAPWGSFM